MNGMGNNGYGSRLGSIRKWFLASPGIETDDSASVGVCRMNYLSHFKSSGGI